MRVRKSQATFSDDSTPSLVWERPDWWLQARCRGVGVDVFFPTDHNSGHHARRVAARYCETCPVKGPCGVQGEQENTGVWAGRLRQVGWRQTRADAAAERRTA
jgi:hypothetical protein